MENRTLYLLALLLTAGTLAACGPSQAELDAQATQTAVSVAATQTAAAPTPTPRPTATPTPTPTPTPPSPQELLKSYSAAAQKVDTYHFDMDALMHVVLEGATMDAPFTVVGDYQAPDRMQMKMSMSVLGTTLDIDAVRIGETNYVTNPATGEWEVAAQPASPISPDMFTGAKPGDLKDVRFIGEEVLDGTPVYRLAGTLPLKATGQAEGELQFEMWLGIDDRLLRQLTANGELTIPGSVFGGAGSGTATITMTMKLTDYGKELNIEAPRIALFRDDFSDPSSGWARNRGKDYTVDYEDGGYRILVNIANTSVWANPGKDFADVSVEVTATKTGGPDNNDFGVVCRYQDADNFYALLISSDGYYVVIANAGGEWQLVGMERALLSGKIKKGSASNIIRADCVGDRLSLYANGSKLVEVKDDRFGSGDVGLIASAYDEPGVDIRFTDFVVFQPSEAN